MGKPVLDGRTPYQPNDAKFTIGAEVAHVRRVAVAAPAGRRTDRAAAP